MGGRWTPVNDDGAQRRNPQIDVLGWAAGRDPRAEADPAEGL